MRTPQKYLVFQAGQPLLLYADAIIVLADLSRDRAERALRALLRLVEDPALVSPHPELVVRDWNGHPGDVCRARPLLESLGFQPSNLRWKGMVYDGQAAPAEVSEAIPEVFERRGSDAAPVEYNADWIVCRSPEPVREKVRELIGFLEETLPEACELEFQPRTFIVRYRGMRCMHPHIQKRQIALHVTWRGWRPGLKIQPTTRLRSADFRGELGKRFERVRGEIDAFLDARQRGE
jgi:hypothetical protein